MGLRSQNNPQASFRDVFSATGIDAMGAAPPGIAQGHTATGGVISDYSEGPTVYRAHIFTSSGIFNVTSTGSFGEDVEYLVVAGGGAGGGGAYNGAGGGAGGYRTGTGMPISVGSYPVIVGGGGAGIAGNYTGVQGGDSGFNNITSRGGGGGGAHDANPRAGNPGGSGGGGTQAQGAAGTGNTPPTSPAQGYPGSGNWYAGAGGGGGAGGPHPGQTGPGNPPFTSSGGTQDKISGGIGVRTPFGGPLYAIGVPGPGGTGGYLAGGGGGGGRDAYGVPQGLGKSGGGDGGPGPDSGHPGSAGTAGTGGGGGGCSGNTIPGTLHGGNGGSGIVVVRYQIGSIQTAKATGGNVSFYDGKTIHTFTSSGTFTVPGTFNETIRYAAIGGGGGGGVQHGGGGGAGGYRTADIPLNAAGSTVNVSVVIGAGGAGMGPKGSLVGTAGGENNGNDTVVSFPSPVTAGKGGGGAQLGPPSGSPAGVGASVPLGSGGGGGMHQPGNSANNFGTAGPNGNPGGRGSTYGEGGHGGVGGGGGGIGGAGGGGADANPDKGKGGVGVQLHPFFRDPAAAPSATTPTEPRFAGERGGGLGTPGPNGQFYVGGGGGGGGHTPWGFGAGPDKAGGDGGAGGGGHGGTNSPGSEPEYWPGTNAVANTGGGGGASGPHTVAGGSGGSGIVLIAYPT